MRKALLVVGIVLLVVVSVPAQEDDSHLVSVGINPFGWIWGSYKIEAAVPLGGLFEVGGQLNYFNTAQFVSLFNVEDTSGLPRSLTLGAVGRIFPAQTASGFFIGGRLMYLNISALGTDQSVNDMTAGIDIGWRFKWDLAGPLGMFFQTYFGVQRWVFAGDLQDTVGLAFPIIPSTGLHFGIYL